MLIDAFSEGKNLDDPAANEDQLLVLPGRGYAVIDGVTDRTGHRYEGMLAGQLAGLTVRDAAASFLLDPANRAVAPERLVAHVTRAIQAAYARFDLTDEARNRPARRFGATLALAAHVDDRIRTVLVGDSGVRFNGRDLVVMEPGLDRITAGIRQAAWRLLEEAGAPEADRHRVSRACVFHGLARLHPDMRPWLDEATLAGLRQAYLDAAAVCHPKIPRSDIETLIDGGIIEGQGQFQNNTKSPLSYCVLDGFAVPMSLVRTLDHPAAAIHTIELFTDGYFTPGALATIESWEAAFEEVERNDPLKLDVHPSVKGTIGRIRADDRTVVIVHL